MPVLKIAGFNSSKQDSPGASKGLNHLLDLITRRRYLLPLTFIILYFASFSLLYPEVFLSPYNLTSLLLEFSIPAIMAVGCSIVFIGGELDLSIGYNALFSSMFAGMLLVRGLPIPLVILITLSAAAIMGLTVGILVTKFRVNSLIVTLATSLIFYGMAQFIFYLASGMNRDGVTMHVLPKAFKELGQHQLIPGMNFQMPALYALIIVVIFSFLLGRTTYFKQFYYVGNNVKTAQLSGIKANKLKVLGFVICSLLASLSGIIFVSRLGSVGLHIGVGMEMRIIAGVVIGGVSFSGGTGTIMGGLIGVLFITCLNNGMRIAEAPSQLFKIIEGIVLLLAIVADAYFSKRKIVG